jgi:uncharacterized damage-inducible protein DinB
MITQTAATVALAELVGYAEDEWQRWKRWFDQHPAALDAPIAIAEAKDVRGLVKHIVLVDLRYAQWLSGAPLTTLDGLDQLTTEQLFAQGDRAFEMLRQVIETTPDAKWAEAMPFPRPLEHLRPTRRKCVTHVAFHSTRHWAQIATALRGAGLATDWQHDFIFTPAMV